MQPNQKWVKLGCTLMTTMLVNPEGVRYLSEDRLLAQLVDCFSNIDEVSEYLYCETCRELRGLMISHRGQPDVHRHPYSAKTV